MFSVTLSALAQDTVWYSQGEARTMRAGTGELHVQLALDVDPSAVSAALVAAGYAELEAIPPVSTSARIYQLAGSGFTSEDRVAIREIAGVAAVRPVYTFAGANRPVYLSDQVIVRFDEGEEGAALLVAEEHGLEIVRHIDWLGEVYVMRVLDESETDAAQLSALLHGDARTVYAHADVMGMEVTKEVRILDPIYAAQWHLDNPGGNGGVLDADIDAPEAWEITEGEGILVAVIDQGTDIAHEDLRDNYSGFGRGYGGRGTGPDPSPISSYEGHGTAVTGLICAEGNEIGVRGVAPKAQFMAMGVIGRGGLSAIVDAFQFATEVGADVICNSWGKYPGFPVPDVEVEAISNAAITGRGGRGMLILFASGNSGIFINAHGDEANIPEVMAVGATLRDDTLSCYSNFGLKQSVVAPGGGASFIQACMTADIVTTDITGDDGYNSAGVPAFFGDPFPILPPDPNELANRNYTNSFNGTSAACPVATGVATLALSVNPNLSRVQLRNLIEHTADKPDVYRGDYDPVTGHSLRLGHGRVNAFNSVVAAQAGKLWPSPVSTIDAFVANDRVDLLWENPDDDRQASVLVVRSGSPIGWVPEDLETYTVGDEAAPGVVVVQDAPFNTLSEPEVPLVGYVEYAFFVRNTQGRYSWGRRKEVSVTSSPDVGNLLQITAQADVTVGQAPLTVQFAGGARVDVIPEIFRWMMDDERLLENGATRPETELFGRAVRHTFAEAGVYYVQLTVTDIEGRLGTTTIPITVNPANRYPVASIQANPTSGFAPLDVSFAAGGQDPDGSIARFVWDFGDGTTGEGAFIDHTYLNAGTYTVTLTILDNDGASSQATVNILVNGAGLSSAQSVSGATDTATTSVLPGFCGALGVEALTLALCGFAVIGFINRRRA